MQINNINTHMVSPSGISKMGGKEAKLDTFGSDRVSMGSVTSQPAIDPSKLKGLFTKEKTKIFSKAQWTQPRPGVGDYDQTLVSSSGSVYARTEKGFCKIDGDNGAISWQAKIPAPLTERRESLWEMKDGSVICATQDNKLHCTDPATGDVKWSHDLGFQFQNPCFVAEDGTVITFHKDGESLNLCRLNPDGSLKKESKLGDWYEPIGDKGSDAKILAVDKKGFVTVHADTTVIKPGESYRPLNCETMSVAPSGRVLSRSHTFAPPRIFASDPNRLFSVDYDKMEIFEPKKSDPLWKLEQTYAIQDPKYGGIGDKLYKIGNDHKYKYLNFSASNEKGILLTTYFQTPPPGVMHTGYELVCLDPKDPSQVLWKLPTSSSYEGRSVFTDGNILLHISDEETGTVEALNYADGRFLWNQPLKDPDSGERELGRDGRMVRISSEIPDNYRIKQGKDGTLYVRTFKNIYGLNPADGSVKYKISAPHEIWDFNLDKDEKNMIVVNNETNEVVSYPITTPSELVSQIAKDMAQEAAVTAGNTQASSSGTDTSAPAKASIEVGKGQVRIGGVLLERDDD